ncbi:MAG: segregation/condensation protein A [Candidatus ainarchaeum sp.]|nr:segregation/condensation protein A [Candidatus ainarchaeum sp.]
MDQLVNIIKQPNWKILLTELVKSNDFDLWNVDLIKLTDLYLLKIKEMKEDNLLIPANALLAAAILLKLKAYSLKLTSIVDDEDELKIPTEDDLLNNINLDNPVRFKEGQVSLDELIDVVDFIMNRPTKQNIDRKIKEKKEEVFVMPKKTEEINIRIKNLYSILKKNVDEVGCITFSFLAKDISNLDLVDNFFIPLLFLNQDKKVNIWQEDFFSEIFIKILN